MVRVYADTNVYARPFDDQRYLQIRLETEAALAFFDLVERLPDILLLSSDVLHYEVRHAPTDKRLKMQTALRLCGAHTSHSKYVLNEALLLQKNMRLHPRDALHLASALVGRADYFVSCDQHFFRETLVSMKGKISVLNPLQFPFFQFL